MQFKTGKFAAIQYLVKNKKILILLCSGWLAIQKIIVSQQRKIITASYLARVVKILNLF